MYIMNEMRHTSWNLQHELDDLQFCITANCITAKFCTPICPRVCSKFCLSIRHTAVYKFTQCTRIVHMAVLLMGVINTRKEPQTEWFQHLYHCLGETILLVHWSSCTLHGPSMSGRLLCEWYGVLGTLNYFFSSVKRNNDLCCNIVASQSTNSYTGSIMWYAIRMDGLLQCM